MRAGRVCGLVLGMVVLMTLLLILLPRHAHEDTDGKQVLIDVEDSRYKKIYKLNEESQREWEEALRHSPIKKIVNEGYTGLATKYLVVFETGHLAIAKLVQPFQLFEQEWEVHSYMDNARYEPRGIGYSRSGRRYQAWTEVASYLVSRIAFPVARKPPATIRSISSRLLYGCQGCTSWSDYLCSWLPEHTVYISVHAYMNQLKISPPSNEMMEYLTHTPEVHRTFHPRVRGWPLGDVVLRNRAGTGRGLRECNAGQRRHHF